MSELPDEVTLEELQALRAERDRLKAEAQAAAARADAEARRADELQTTVVSNSRTIAESQLQNLSAQETQAQQTISTLDAELASLKRDFANLQAEGKFEEAADVQEKMGIAAARRVQAEQAKTYYAKQREQVAAQPVDPVERFLANGQYNDAEKDWIRKHPRYATDRGFQERVNRAHAEAQAGGVAPGSPEYFQKLEAAGYMRAQPQPEPLPRGNEPRVEPEPEDSPYSTASEEEPPVQPARQPVRAVAAAPTRRPPASPTRAPGGGRELTPEEAETALKMSEYFPDEVKEGGEAAIYAHYATLKASPMARRLREQWAAGA